MSDQHTQTQISSAEVHEVFADLHTRYGVRGLEEKRADQAFVRTDRDEAVAVLTHLRDRHGYTHLAFLTAVDQIEEAIEQSSAHSLPCKAKRSSTSGPASRGPT